MSSCPYLLQLLRDATYFHPEYSVKVLSTCVELRTYFYDFVSLMWSKGEYKSLIISNNPLFTVNRAPWRGRMESSCFASIRHLESLHSLCDTFLASHFWNLIKSEDKLQNILGGKAVLSSLMNLHIPGCILLIKNVFCHVNTQQFQWPIACSFLSK